MPEATPPAPAVAPSPPRPDGEALGRILVPLGALLCLAPFMTTGLGLLLGLVLALTVGNPHAQRTKAWTSTLLSLSVMGLGAGMDLRAVARAGASGVVYTVLGIATALLLGALLSRLLGVERLVAALITVGTAICGGSAIAAVAAVLRPKEHETTVALATVFLLNAVALFVFPPVGHFFGLTDTQFGLWSAIAIHDTSSVVGAAVAWGGGAVAVATTVKLARALWIVPLTLALGAWNQRHPLAGTDGQGPAGKPKRPWFILGFVLAAALVTYVPALQAPGHWAAAAAKQAMVLVLFLIGAGLSRKALREVGVKPLVFGVILWLAMAGASLGAVVGRVIG
jgi:uncharacterized integral membrane protein (TIGR00698 family)